MSGSAEPTNIPWPIKGVVTLFYYDDVRRAVDFYQRVVGLKKVVDLGWCALFEIHGPAHLGVIDGARGSQRPVPGNNKGALLMLETDDLEGCHQRMKQAGAAGPTTTIRHNPASRTNEFKIYDPEGYAIEFFSWIQPPPPAGGLD